MNKNPVVHFEMPAKDGKRVSEFYKAAFGWDMAQMGAQYGEYIVATTTDSDEKTGRPTTPGTINGGFYTLQEGIKDNGNTVVISVDNLEEAMKRVTDAGGTLSGEPMDIPSIGKYIAIIDTEGNRVGLLQPAPMMSK